MYVVRNRGRISKEDTRCLQFICQEMRHVLLPLRTNTNRDFTNNIFIINIIQIIVPILPLWFISVVGPLCVVFPNNYIKTCFSYSFLHIVHKQTNRSFFSMRKNRPWERDLSYIYLNSATNSGMVLVHI